MRESLLISLLVLGPCIAGAASDTPPATPVAAMQESLQKQQNSLEKQRQSLAAQSAGDQANLDRNDFIAPLIPPATLSCLPLNPADIDALITPAAKTSGVTSSLLRAVMKQESGFKPCAVSEKGALGLMQLMPATADQFQVSDPFDPVQNVNAGAALLKQLLTRYKGDLRLTLAAYNAGANRADQAAANSGNGADPYPAETQGYIAAIFADLGMDQTKSSAGPTDDPPSDAPAEAESNNPNPQRQ